MESFTFTIDGEVVGKMRPKATSFGGHARVYTPAKQVNNENWIRMEYVKQAQEKDFKGFGDRPLKIEIYLHLQVPKSLSRKKREKALQGKLMPTKKPDLDNIVKTILDALNSVAFDDDRQVVSLHATKDYACRNYTQVTITEMNESEVVPFIGIDWRDDELCL